MNRLIPRASIVCQGALTLVFAVACDRGVPAAHDTARAEQSATVLIVERLDEEGGVITRAPRSDSGLGAFFRDEAVLVDARALVEHLAPNSRVDAAAGTLRLDGSDTGIPAELRDGVSYVPLAPLVDRFRAYARTERQPGRMVTVWPHDILCRYARGADRRAEVFLGAAEQGLLRQCSPAIDARVRRWASAQPSEEWAASLTLRQPLDSASTASLLARHRARPYAIYGAAAGHQVIVRASADSASFHLIAMFRNAAVDALERGLCGLPAALERRVRGTMSRSRARDSDPFHGERYMLASAQAASRELARVRAGAPIILGVDILAPAGELRRLATDARVRRFDPATKLDDDWVLPGADLGAASGLPSSTKIAALDSAALFASLAAEAARAAADCRSLRTR